MGSLTLPSSGSVYLDASPVIYGVEKHPDYGPLLMPLWQSAALKAVEIVSSDLVLLEVLVGPLKSGNIVLARTYQQFFQQAQTRLLPITHAILYQAARLRATTSLRTPDAIHAATATDAGCTLFVTNDRSFRAALGLPVLILDELLSPNEMRCCSVAEKLSLYLSRSSRSF